MSMSCDNRSTREIVARNVGGDPCGRPLEHSLKGESYRFAGGN